MKLFPLIREIKSRKGELHFRRWRIVSTPWFAVYLHGIYKADEDYHLHNHPWSYVSIPVFGELTESRLYPDGRIRNKKFGFGQIACRKAGDFHKIAYLTTNKVFTLFFVGRRKEEKWGYWVNGEFVDNEQYRILKRNNQL